MGSRAYALMTGAFIVVFASAIAIIAWWLAGGEQERDPFVVVARDEITGLKEGSPVLYRGVSAGSVATIEFNPDDYREILIRIRVRAGLPITRGTYATLRPQGITGLSQIVLHDDGEYEEPLPTDVESPARIPLEPGLLDQLTGSGESVLQRFESLLARLNELLGEENRERIGGTLANLEAATARLVELQDGLRPTLEAMPEMTSEATRTLAEIRELAVGLQALPPELERLTANANAFLESGESVGRELRADVAPELTIALRELAGASDELRRLARELREHPQSVLQGKPRRAPGPGESGYGGGRP